MGSLSGMAHIEKLEWIKRELKFHKESKSILFYLKQRGDGIYKIKIQQGRGVLVLNKQDLKRYECSSLNELYDKFVSNRETLMHFCNNQSNLMVPYQKDELQVSLERTGSNGYVVEAEVALRYGIMYKGYSELKRWQKILDHCKEAYGEEETKEIKMTQLFDAKKAVELTKEFVEKKMYELLIVKEELEKILAETIEKEVLSVERKLNNRE